MKQHSSDSVTHDWYSAEHLDTLLDTWIERLGAAPSQDVPHVDQHALPRAGSIQWMIAVLRELGTLRLCPAARAAGRARIRTALLRHK